MGKADVCKTCLCETTETGHMCDPKSTKHKVYVCSECGIITVNKELVCKPKILKLK